MTMTFKHSGAPVGDSELDAYEQQWGTKLPAEYREFLKQHNGGQPIPGSFSVKGSGTSSVALFHRVGTTDIDDAWSTYKSPDDLQVPAELIPIAECVGGDHLMLAVDGPNKGRVYFWDHEDYHLCDQDKPPAMSDVYFVADSLGEFLGQLVAR